MNNESILSKLFPGRIIIPKEVYDELSHPGVNRVKGIKAQVDIMVQSGAATIETIVVGQIHISYTGSLPIVQIRGIEL